ncbi:MAG: family 16 glycoside hydrolase [Planctomycetota bacterium]|nr:family 16 glycoside hydrolase [Planctomycetota bacterium]
MNHCRLTSSHLLALVLLTASLGAYENPPTEPGFVSLFDGKNIEEHFIIKGKKESWTVKDGVIHSLRGGNRIISREKYGDFVLRLDWRISEQGNSGIFIRVPGQDDGAPWVSGYEVQISTAPRDDAHCTASLYGVEATSPRPTKEAEGANTWHSYEITCLGGRISVRLDGVLNIDADEKKNAKMRSRPRVGFIGLQDYHSSKGWVEYRNIRIQPLQPNGVPAGFESLSANDKGWRKIRTGHGSGGQWAHTDGTWEGQQDPPGSGNGGVLVTDRKLSDFELVIETKPDWGVCSGIFLRSTERGQCYQLMVDWHGNGNVAGIYGEGTGGFNVRNYELNDDKTIRKGNDNKQNIPLAFALSDWKKVWRFGQYNEVRARITSNPPTIDTWLNGWHISHFEDDKKRIPDAGSVAIQVHGGKGWPKGAKVRFRNISVRELKK